MVFKSSNILTIGISLAVLNALMASCMSLFGKLLSQYYGPIQVTFLNNSSNLVILFIWIILSGNLQVFKTERPFAHILRGAFGTCSLIAGMKALSLMPLATTTILFFTTPLFVVLLSYFILKEPVGIYRFSAVFIGFIGVIIIANPTSDMNQLPTLGIIAGLLWGFFTACSNICLRWMGKTEGSTTTVFYFVLFGAIATSIHWPFAEVKPGGLSIDVIWIVIGMGVFGLTSKLSKAQSLRLVEASVAAPYIYSMIIWTMLFDFIFWDKTPSFNVMAGAAIIISSNLFILYREARKKAQQKA